MIKEIEGGVTAAKGFEASACAAGIKYKERTDMAIVYSKAPCTSAGVYTGNVVKAACVLYDKEVTESGDPVHAVVINAGIANACTGEQGLLACRETAAAASEALSVPESSVLVASTGVIGMQLPVDKLVNGVGVLAATLSEGPEAGDLAAHAIMTTDTVDKQMAVEFTVGGKTAHLGGMCKGSGMIHPKLCTMLGFLTTDCAIAKPLLYKALKEDVEDTFNMVSVDGDTSTNDTLVILANGLAGNETITAEGPDYEAFKEALHHVTSALARKMATDGEGATALMEVTVKNAASKVSARVLAKSVIGSSLTKAAIFGHDANWGRILCALGYSGESFDPENVTLSFSDGKETIVIFEKGVATDYSEETATRILSAKEVYITADMHMGSEEATAFGCDLSYDYVKINADYRS